MSRSSDLSMPRSVRCSWNPDLRYQLQVLVASMLLCAANKRFCASSQIALQALVDADASLAQRVARANGKKYLRSYVPEEKLDTMPPGCRAEVGAHPFP